MGLFAFRRLREFEALAKAEASFTIAEPQSKLEEPTPAALDDGSNNRRNGGRRKRQQLPDIGGS